MNIDKTARSSLYSRAEIVRHVMAANSRKACKTLSLRHIRIKPYTPKTSGKAERFIQTGLPEWTYARAYPTSEHRKQALQRWLRDDNWHRPNGSLQSMTPVNRLGQTMSNVRRF